MCPSAIDTTYYGYTEALYPVLKMMFEDLTVYAGQNRTDETHPGSGDWKTQPLDEHARPDWFMVTGTAGRLPNEVPLTATWSTLTRTYGQGIIAEAGGRPLLTFKRLPGVFFILDDFQPEISRAVEVDSTSTIPGNVAIVEVEIGGI